MRFSIMPIDEPGRSIIPIDASSQSVVPVDISLQSVLPTGVFIDLRDLIPSGIVSKSALKSKDNTTDRTIKAITKREIN